MNAPAGLIGAAGEAQEQLSRAGFRFRFIGVLAPLRWGEPRRTPDVGMGVRWENLAKRMIRYRICPATTGRPIQ